MEMTVLGFKFDPGKSETVEVPCPLDTVALSVVVPKGKALIIGGPPIELQPMVLVGLSGEESEDATMTIQIVTTGESAEGFKYLDSIFWNQSLYHLFWEVKATDPMVIHGFMPERAL